MRSKPSSLFRIGHDFLRSSNSAPKTADRVEADLAQTSAIAQPSSCRAAKCSMNRDLPSVEPGEPLRPRALALLLLASGDLLPRRRARDQQADVAGMQLKRDLLTRLAVLDPEPDQLEAALVHI